MKKPNGYWTEERVISAAKKCKSRIEFRWNNLGAYNSARRNNWLRHVWKILPQSGNRYNKKAYAYEFPDKHVYVGVSYNLETRGHLYKGPVYNHMIRTGLKPKQKFLTGFFDVSKTKTKEKWWQDWYKRRGWIALHKAEPGATGNQIIKWTKERYLAEALKYKTREEFGRKKHRCYDLGLKEGWHEEGTKHMGKPVSGINVPIVAIKNNKKIYYSSITSAATNLGLHISGISAVITGRLYTTGGYTFKRA